MTIFILHANYIWVQKHQRNELITMLYLHVNDNRKETSNGNDEITTMEPFTKSKYFKVIMAVSEKNSSLQPTKTVRMNPEENAIIQRER